jgi:hypothetical protein
VSDQRRLQETHTVSAEEMNDATRFGMTRAARYFADKAKGKPRVELHVDRNELAAIIGAAYQAGRLSMRPDRDDYEQRWLAECRAHGETKRALETCPVCGSATDGSAF